MASLTGGFFMDTTVRTFSSNDTPLADGSDHKLNDSSGVNHNIVEEPLEGDGRANAVLEALGIPEDTKNIPSDELDRLRETTDYLSRYLSKRGMPPTKSNFARAMDNVKAQLGIDYDVTGNVLLDKLGSIVSAYKDLAFIGDPREKRSILMKLARQPDTRSINRVIFEEMNKREVWNGA